MIKELSAWKDWQESEDGKLCLEASTLEVAIGQADFQRYLLNRLHTAFLAGWDAAGDSAKKVDDGNKPRLAHDHAEVN